MVKNYIKDSINIVLTLVSRNIKEKNIYNTIIKEFDINLVYVIDNEKLATWIKNGAKPTDSVKELVERVAKK